MGVAPNVGGATPTVTASGFILFFNGYEMCQWVHRDQTPGMGYEWQASDGWSGMWRGFDGRLLVATVVHYDDQIMDGRTPRAGDRWWAAWVRGHRVGDRFDTAEQAMAAADAFVVPEDEMS